MGISGVRSCLGHAPSCWRSGQRRVKFQERSGGGESPRGKASSLRKAGRGEPGKGCPAGAPPHGPRGSRSSSSRITTKGLKAGAVCVKGVGPGRGLSSPPSPLAHPSLKCARAAPERKLPPLGLLLIRLFEKTFCLASPTEGAQPATGVERGGSRGEPAIPDPCCQVRARAYRAVTSALPGKARTGALVSKLRGRLVSASGDLRSAAAGSAGTYLGWKRAQVAPHPVPPRRNRQLSARLLLASEPRCAPRIENGAAPGPGYPRGL